MQVMMAPWEWQWQWLTRDDGQQQQRLMAVVTTNRIESYLQLRYDVLLMFARPLIVQIGLKPLTFIHSI